MKTRSISARSFFTIASAILCLTFAAQAFGQEKISTTDEDKAAFRKIMEQLETENQLYVHDRMVKVAKLRLGTPYVASTLEKEPERLVIDIVETDCILYVESNLAMALTVSKDFNDFADNILRLRYRNGVVDGYASRIHYTSEWLLQAAGRGLLEEITEKIGGQRLDQSFSYMSTHPQNYKQLKNNPAEVARIAAAEAELNKHDYYVIPKARIPELASKIKDGDIICFIGSTKGLDITHVAIALWDNGKLTFMHASPKYGKAVIEPSGLAGYCNSIKSNVGIRVARLRF